MEQNNTLSTFDNTTALFDNTTTLFDNTTGIIDYTTTPVDYTFAPTDYTSAPIDNSSAPFDNTSDSTDYINFHDDSVIYPGFEFEVPVYLYMWPVLVSVTCAINIIVIIVLLRKKMRNPTNTVLAVIAMSDSLTGLVTIPSFIMVFSKWESGADEYFYDYYGDNLTEYWDNYTTESQAAYIISPDLCRFYMISKFYVAMVFHTMSIWMTLFLGFQRFVYVSYPFVAQKMFSLRNTVIACSVLCALSPILHIYHVFDDKVSTNFMCEWRLTPGCKGGGCVYLWLSFFLKQCIPCILLVFFTVMFIFNLKKGEQVIERSQTGTFQKRQSENRRVSLIVAMIVVLFLIPEVPYGAFLLYAAICHTASISFDLKTNREIQAAYEIVLVLSFHANFWIYTAFNARFRTELKCMFSCVTGWKKRISKSIRSTTWTGSKYTSRTADTSTKNSVEMMSMDNRASERLFNSSDIDASKTSKTIEASISQENSIAV